MSYLEATDRTFTIPKTRPMTALERTILEGSENQRPGTTRPKASSTTLQLHSATSPRGPVRREFICSHRGETREKHTGSR